MSKRALGRGIDALILGGGEEESSEPTTAIATVPITQILPGDGQPRKTFNEESLAELADSIRSQGILQPILVERVGQGFAIVAGERRFRAAQKAGLSEVPVVIKEFSRDQKLQIALVENIQREDLTPIEEAEAYRTLMNALKISQEELASRLGKKRSTVANSLRLLNLPEEMQNAVSSGAMTSGHARAVLSASNPADRELLFRRIVEHGISVREAEAAAESLNRGKRASKESPPKAVKKRDPQLGELEQKLIDRIGSKVVVRGDLERGKIEITYFSRADLDRIFELLED